MIRWCYLFIFLAFLFACDTASNISQPNKNYFIKYFGGDGIQTARDLIVNSDGTFFILGNSTQADGATQKVFLAKANEFGELTNQITYGQDMDARDFVLTSDGSIAVVANKNSSSPSDDVDILLTRFTLDLVPIDSAIVFAGPTNILSENANSLTELSDGGFIIEGYIGNRLSKVSLEIHLRVDHQLQKFVGALGWQDQYKLGTKSVGVRAVQNLITNEYYTFGHTDAAYKGTANSNNIKFWAFNYVENGSPKDNTDLPWFEQSGVGDDNTLTDVVIVPSGGYLLVGYSSSISLSEDNLKAIITTSNYPGLKFNYSDVAHDLILKDNSPTPVSLLGKGSNPFVTAYSSVNNYNFILANSYNAQTSKSDILLIKVDNNLLSLWGGATEPNYVSFGGDGDDTAAAVAELPDGHIMVLGTMQLGNPPGQYKIVLMKLNSSGKLAD